MIHNAWGYHINEVLQHPTTIYCSVMLLSKWTREWRMKTIQETKIGDTDGHLRRLFKDIISWYHDMKTYENTWKLYKISWNHLKSKIMINCVMFIHFLYNQKIWSDHLHLQTTRSEINLATRQPGFNGIPWIFRMNAQQVLISLFQESYKNKKKQ